MTRDEMIKLAIEAGWQYADGDDGYSALWRFAALVAAVEREACAKVCDEHGWNVTNWCAAAIRARGEK